MRLLVAFLLLCLPSLAQAGQRAVYVNPEGKHLTIDIADDGNAVARPEGEDQYGIVRDGEFYLIAREDGVLKVARMRDVAAAFDQTLGPIFRTLFEAAGKSAGKSTMKMEPKGNRKIGPWTGQAYSISWTGGGNSQEPTLYVLSSDPQLQPTGRVMEHFMVAITLMLAPFVGEEAAQTATDVRTIFAKGAPLEIEGQFRLVSVEPRNVQHEEVELPGKPQTVEEILKSMKISSPSEATEDQ